MRWLNGRVSHVKRSSGSNPVLEPATISVGTEGDSLRQLLHCLGLSIHGFLRVLERDHGVPRTVGDAVSVCLQRAKNFVAPLWWRAR